MALYHYSIKLSPEVGLSPAVFLLSILVSIIYLPIAWIVLIPTKVILQKKYICLSIVMSRGSSVPYFSYTSVSATNEKHVQFL
jgi:hypothetical protein